MQSSPLPPRLAVVSDAILPYNKGGKETRINELTRRLASRGAFRIDIYTMSWWERFGNKSASSVAGISVSGICPYLPLYRGRRRSKLQAVAFGFSCLRLVRRQFDIVEVDQIPFIPLFVLRLIATIRRKPLLATWHEVWGPEHWREYLGPWSGQLASVIEKLSVSMPDIIVAASDTTAVRLREQFGVANVVTVTNGVNVPAVMPASDRDIDVLFVGRLLKHKRVDLLLEAVHILKKTRPDVRVAIVGVGPELTNLQSIAARRKLQENIEFHGEIADHSTIVSLMSRAKVFGFPSEREGFGLAVVEAMGCGAAVVTTDHPDNAARHLVEHTVSGFITQRNATAVATSLDAALKDWAHLGEAGRKRAQAYSWESSVDIVQEILATSIEQRRTRRHRRSYFSTKAPAAAAVVHGASGE